MKIKFLGAAGTVTGSGYLVTTAKSRVLVDFGMFQGTAAEEALNKRPLTFNPRDIDALFLTHAHLDHCGRIPRLTKNGLHVPIFATIPTQELAEVVMYDSAKIASIENRSSPLYRAQDVEAAISLFKTAAYHDEFTFQDLKVEYINAGHILGSASIKLTDLSSNISVAFSGDIGSYPDTIVKDTEFFDSADYVIMESTYGGRTHPDSDPKQELEAQFDWLKEEGSTLLIPSFALQKTQVLLHLIKALNLNKSIQVFLDSPMAEAATAIYQGSNELKYANFRFPNLKAISTPNQSKKINKDKGKKAIIAGSGMMTGGRILAHAKKYLGNPSARILFVGYQGVETLGREIKEGARSINIDGKDLTVKASVESIESMSSHADHPRLLNWLNQIKNVKEVILTHGEDEGRIPLASDIRRKLNIPEVKLPRLDEELDLN